MKILITIIYTLVLHKLIFGYGLIKINQPYIVIIIRDMQIKNNFIIKNGIQYGIR